MRFRSQPSEVEAVQWTGDNADEIIEFASAFCEFVNGPVATGPRELMVKAGVDGAQGWVSVPVGHWIVKSVTDPIHAWPVDDTFFNGKYQPGGTVDRFFDWLREGRDQGFISEMFCNTQFLIGNTPVDVLSLSQQDGAVPIVHLGIGEDET